MHPEAAACVRHMRGRTLEVGCGSNPTPGVNFTVDHTPRGERGTAGSQEGEVSRAAVCARMDYLPFESESFYTLVARHVLEHHHDTLEVIREWWRVADRLVLVVPDQRRYPGNTVELDPTHEAAFTPRQLQTLVEHVTHRRVWTATCVPAWSFILVAE